MERLTLINSDGDLCRTSCEISDGDAWRKLAEYEDTGYEPQTIANLDNICRTQSNCIIRTGGRIEELENEITSLKEALSEYRGAEEQGLLIKLPTPIHKYLYDIHYGNVQKYRAIGYEIDIDGKWYVKIPYGRIPFTDFGVKVFLTREAAEEALKGSVPE